MNFPFFVARRFFSNVGSEQRRASHLTTTIATTGVAIGLIVMLLSVGIILGFKQEITKKVEGFGSHIEILDVSSLAAPDAYPVHADTQLINSLKRIPEVRGVAPIAQKMGILKTKNDYMGITLKGIPADYDTTFLANSLVEGRLPKRSAAEGAVVTPEDGVTSSASNEILLSRRQADELNLKVGDRVFAYFFEETIKMRRFKVCGIYQSNMAIFDKTFVITDLNTVRKLNHWEGDEATVIEVRLKGMDAIDQTLPQVERLCSQLNDEVSHARKAFSIVDHYASIFSWLQLLDFNMMVILVLMLCVSGFTMVSGLFILILERTQTIGVLKAMGATNTKIRNVFLHFAGFIIVRGLLIGDVVTIGLLLIQQKYGLIHLDPANYYVETVPVEINLWAIVLVNVGTLVLTTLALVLPSYMVSRIQPSKAIKFE
ncbi:ABC transporter permease [Ihuprevotella massiliensis]|uniref:ABC transporter permease n=1 Tax=Ihuprevotella massiliensis TaxID=1852368 RepID=UPI00094E3068